MILTVTAPRYPNALTDESVNHLLDTTDAAVWAETFCKIQEQDGFAGGIDVNLMLTWFACAIETGRQRG